MLTPVLYDGIILFGLNYSKLLDCRKKLQHLSHLRNFSIIFIISSHCLVHSEILRLAEIKSQVKTALNCGVKYHLPTSVPCTERAFHRHLERLPLALKSGEDNRAKFEILHQKQYNVDANPTAGVQGFPWISIGSLRLQQHWGIIENLQKFPKTSTKTLKSNLVWLE